MKKVALLVCTFLALVSASFAATTPSVASLKGTYAVQTATVRLDSWAMTLSCVSTITTTTTVDPVTGIVSTNKSYTYQNFTGGGSVAQQEVAMGTFVFDGAGHVTAHATIYNKFDENASNATVGACNDIGNGTSTGLLSNGHPVFRAPQGPNTLTGTYTVAPNGTGAILLPTGDGYAFMFAIAEINGRGIASTVLINTGQANNDGLGNVSAPGYHNIMTGTAVLQ